MYHIYLDAEFDAVFMKGKFHQSVISLGAVIANDKRCIIDDFYMLVCPKHFRRLTPVVRRMTHLKSKDILEAVSLEEMLTAFFTWLSAYDNIQNFATYSYGPDDKRTIVQNCQMSNIDDHGFFSTIKDVQKIISQAITYQNTIVSSTLSLDDAKYVYNLGDSVDHNALMDARDLKFVHDAFLLQKPQNTKHIKEIVERKLQKQQASRLLQQEKLRKIMKERFEGYPETETQVILYPEVIQTLHMWQERDRYFHLHVFEGELIDTDKAYELAQLSITLQLHVQQDIPSVSFRLYYQKDVIEKKYMLTYRNASMVEAIFKRLSG